MLRRNLIGFTLAFLLALPGLAFAQAQSGTLLLNAVAATGAGSNVLDTSLRTTATYQVSGTFVATVTFQGNVDGTNWVSLPCYGLDDSGPTSTATATGVWRCNVQGIPQIRANVTAFTSGTITVFAQGLMGTVQPRSVTTPVTSVFTTTLNPVAITRNRVAAGLSITALSNDQTFSITGLNQLSPVFVNGPAPTVACPPLGWRVSAAGTLSGNFGIFTTATCTPATGTYQIVQPGVAQPSKIFTLTLNPTAITRLNLALSGNFGIKDQNFTVTGLDQSMKVFVNGPAPTVACPPTSWRVSSANTLTGSFLDLTTAVCTPATGTYQIAAY